MQLKIILARENEYLDILFYILLVLSLYILFDLHEVLVLYIQKVIKMDMQQVPAMVDIQLDIQ